jgi:hypothetical protein
MQSRKFTDSILDKVIGFFNTADISSSTMSLGLTQSLTEMSARNPPRGEGRPSPLSLICLRKCGSLNLMGYPDGYRDSSLLV